jgi:hypothetical protein
MPQATGVFRDPRVRLTPEQREMRARVYKQIEYEPEQFDMASWENSPGLDETALQGSTMTQCGTTRCIGGWSDFFTHGRVRFAGVQTRAVVQLGLTEREYRGPTPYGSLFACDNHAALLRMRQLVEHPDEPREEDE